MDLTCSECGKTYNVDESKMDRARGRVTCLVCGHVIVVEAAPVDLREKETLAGVDLRHVQPKIQGMSIRMKITLIMVERDRLLQKTIRWNMLLLHHLIKGALQS